MPRSQRVTLYSHNVDLAWMTKKLKEYYGLIERGPEYDNYMDLRDRILRIEPTVREILKRLDPALADCDIDPWDNWARPWTLLTAALELSPLAKHARQSSPPDIPVLPADQFHPWVWRAARTLWDSAHYRHAVQAAATAINDHTQNKLGRRDIADTQLMQEAFSPHLPEPGRPRLRCPGDPSSPTTQSRQRGALQYAAGCFIAIRNPATHGQGEWDQETALECLAALSLLARWIDDWTLDKAT